MNRSFLSVLLLVGFGCGITSVRADDASASVPSKHQLMKDCMAKQKASDGGVPKEQMKQNCKDVTKTERENDKAEKQSADKGGGRA